MSGAGVLAYRWMPPCIRHTTLSHHQMRKGRGSPERPLISAWLAGLVGDMLQNVLEKCGRKSLDATNAAIRSRQ
jgi:hypothetical protein